MYNREKSHPNLGYDWRQFGMGFDNLELSESGKLLWPQRDKYMIQASIDNYLNSEAPFHVYYLTISGHMPYSNNVWPISTEILWTVALQRYHQELCGHRD